MDIPSNLLRNTLAVIFVSRLVGRLLLVVALLLVAGLAVLVLLAVVGGRLWHSLLCAFWGGRRGVVLATLGEGGGRSQNKQANLKKQTYFVYLPSLVE